MAKIAKSMHQNNDQNEDVVDKNAKLIQRKGAEQPDPNLLTMIAVLFAIFFISLVISKLMQ